MAWKRVLLTSVVAAGERILMIDVAVLGQTLRFLCRRGFTNIIMAYGTVIYEDWWMKRHVVTPDDG